MITLHITFTVPSESLTAAMDAMRTVRQHIAEEPTCRYFNVYRFAQPGTFRLVEVWDEDVNFLSEVYPNKEYLKTYLKRMEEIGWKDRKVEVLNEVEGFAVNRGLPSSE